MKTGWINIFKPFEGKSLCSYETTCFIYDTKEEAINSMGINDDLIIDTIQITFKEEE